MANITKNYNIYKVSNKNNYRRITQEIKKIEGVVTLNIDKNQDVLFIENYCKGRANALFTFNKQSVACLVAKLFYYRKS